MTGHGQKLSRNREKAISALLSSPSIPKAAQKVGVGEKTLFRWLQIESFKKAYLKARREIVNQAIAQIQGGMSEAVKTLKNVMHNKKAPASARVSAAKAMLDMGLKAVEIDELEGRIEVLENTLKENRI